MKQCGFNKPKTESGIILKDTPAYFPDISLVN